MTTVASTTPTRRPPRGILMSLLLLTVPFLLTLIAVIGLVVLFPPEDLVRRRLETAATAVLGRPVTIRNVDLTVRPTTHAVVEDIVVANPQGMAGEPLLKVGRVEASLKLRPLLAAGVAAIDGLTITAPHLTLTEDAAGNRNWVLNGASGETDKSGLAVLLRAAEIADGRVTVSSPTIAPPIEVTRIGAKIDTDPQSGKTSAKGTLDLKGDEVTFDVALDDIKAVTAGGVTGVKSAIASKHVTGTIAGTASLGEKKGLGGEVDISSPSLTDLARWLGVEITPNGAPLAATVKGKVNVSAEEVGFQETDVGVGDVKGRLDGKLALTGPRPMLEGSFVTDRLDIDALIGTPRSAAPAASPEADDGEPLEITTVAPWQGLADALARAEQGNPGAAPEPAEAEQAAAPTASGNGWSNDPIDFAVLRKADLNLGITASSLGYRSLDLKNAKMRTKLTDGVLEARIESLDVGPGKATGALMLDTSKATPEGRLDLAMREVEAEPIVREVTGKPLLSGRSNVEIDAKVQGKSQRQLAASVDGKARFRMTKGTIRGFDVRHILSNWWSSLTQGLKFDLSKKTGFERLDAQYDIADGIMRSAPGLDIGGGEIEVQSKGNVSLPQRRLDQEIKVKVVPPPTAPAFPIRISGSWSKPALSMDWDDLLFGRLGVAAAAEAGGDGATSFGELAPDAVPSEVTDAARRVLESETARGTLSEEGQALLRSLLPPGHAAAPAPEAAPEATPESMAAPVEGAPNDASATPAPPQTSEPPAALESENPPATTTP